MPYKNIIEFHYKDINNMQDSLMKLTNAYRMMISGANELNGIAIAKKRQIRDALKRADEIGNIIDSNISAIERSECRYFDYCVMYSNQMKTAIDPGIITNEIQRELRFDDDDKEEKKK